MWVGISQPGGKTEWDAFWADVNKIGAQAPSVGATIKPRVRRSFNEAGDGLPATYSAAACKIDPDLGVISAWSWVPRKPGTTLTGAAAYKEGVNDIAAGNQDTAITAFGNSVPDGQLLDMIPCHEWNAKVNDGVITKAEYVAMAKHLGDLAVSLRAATKPDGSWKYPKWRNQIRVGVCSTGYGIRTGQIKDIDDLLQSVDIHTEDPYGKGGTLSAAPVPQTNTMWSDFVAPFLPGGTKDTQATPSRLRAGAIWEASCRTDNTTYDAWPGTTNHRPYWVQALLDNCLSKGYDYVSCFNSTVGGSQATFEQPEDRRQLAEWMAKNADMGPLPTSWPARVDGSTNQPPTPPKNLKATVGADKRPALTWTASTDDVAVTGYTLSRNGTALTPALSGSAVSFTEPAALADGTYVYLLRAYDAQGLFSTYSPQITVTVGTGGPGPLVGLPLGPVGILKWQMPSPDYPKIYGAIGTYKPSGTTTGVPAGTSLTQQTGDVTVTVAGTVLDSLDIHGRVLVRAANVTIQRCIVRGRSSTANESCVDATNAACTGLVIQDCEIVPEYPSVWVNGVNGHDFTARRCNVRNVVDGFGLYNTNAPGTALNVTLEQNWVHDLAYVTPDVNHSSDNQTHNDGTQVQGGTGMVMRGNLIDSHYGTAGTASPTTTANPTPSGATSPALSCVLFNVNVGTTSGHTITDNWFSGGYIPINCGGAPGVNLGNMWRNRFSRDSLVTSGTPQTILLRADQTCDTGDGTANQNVFDDNGAAVLVRRNG